MPYPQLILELRKALDQLFHAGIRLEEQWQRHRQERSGNRRDEQPEKKPPDEVCQTSKSPSRSLPRPWSVYLHFPSKLVLMFG